MSVHHYTSTGVNLVEIPEILRANGGGLDGYIYVIEFSTGTLKAGRSNNPRGRVKTHLEHARKFGATISRLWLSVPHANYKENEAILLQELGEPSFGAEYFASTGFDDAVAIAESALFFHVLTDSEREALEADEKLRAEAKIAALRKWTGDQDLVRIALHPDINAWIANLLFGNCRELPKFGPERDLVAARHALETLSLATGIDVTELSEWSFLDVLEFMGKQQVAIGIANLTIFAYESGRHDLVARGFYRNAMEAQP